jgi:chromate transporter
VDGASTPTQPPGSAREVLLVFFRLGLTSFGGPMAHLGYFYDEIVARRRWLDERAYADLVALCQFLPGPASSQVGIGIGLARAGVPGALAAWLGFTLPSALALVLFAGALSALDGGDAGWLHGLKLAAVAVVAHALRQMASKLTPDATRATFAVLCASAVLLWPGTPTQLAAVAAGAAAGWALLHRKDSSAADDAEPIAIAVSKTAAAALLLVFAALLLVLPLLASQFAGAGADTLAVADAFYRAGSLVFGGGHVVLPLLQSEVVAPGWVTQSAFVAGYGAAQAVPGPLFTFSAFLGAVMAPGAAGLWLALVALVAIFLPSFLLVVGMLPFWAEVRHAGAARAALAGVNAVVVGLLLAALYDPVWISAVGNGADVALVLAAYLLLAVYRWPAWLVVAFCAVGGFAIAAL